MPSTESTELLAGGLVRIVGGKDKKVWGGGVLLGPRHVLTCAHVVARATGHAEDFKPAPTESLWVEFPASEREDRGVPRREATALSGEWIALDDGDVAVVELKGDAPADAAAPPFISPVEGDHDYWVYGFDQGRSQPVLASGIVRGRVRDFRRWQLDRSPGSPYGLTGGFSGCAVWDHVRGAVIGIASERDERSPDAAFMIPVDFLLDLSGHVRRAAAWRPRFAGVDRGHWDPDSWSAGPAELREHFVDRPDAMRALEAWVTEGRAGACAAVGGMGSGKSAVLRELLRRLDPDEHEHERVARPVAVAIVATGRGLDDRQGAEPGIAGEIARWTGVRAGPAPAVAKQLLARAGSAPPPLLVVDQVEDALDADAVLEFLLDLARRGAASVVFALQTSLDRTLPAHVKRVDLDEESLDPAAMPEYVEWILRERGWSGAGAVGLPGIAEAVADKARPSFLVARLSALAIATSPEEVTPATSFPKTVSDAMNQYVDAVARRACPDDARERNARAEQARHVLGALAHGRGPGLPAEGAAWPAMATHLSGHAYGPEDVQGVVRDFGPLLRSREVADLQWVRLFHDALDVALREQSPKDAQQRLARGLLELVQTLPDEQVDPYAAQHLSGHSREAGEEAWDALAAVPCVLDQLAPEAMRADAIAASLEGATVPGAVLGVARSHALGARGTVNDRTGLRHLGMARGAGRSAFTDDDVCAPVARWALRSAHLRRSPPHLPLHAGDKVHALAAFARPDGAWWLVAGCAGGEVRVWNPATGALVASLDAGERGAARAVGGCRVGDSVRVVIGRADGTVELWDPDAGSDVLHRFPTKHAGGVRAVVPFMLDGRLAIATSGDDDARVWTEEGGLRWTLECPGPVRALAVAEVGGIRLVAGRDDALVGVWALPPAADVAGARLPGSPLRGATDWVRAVAAWPEDDALAVAASGEDRRLSRWRADEPLDHAPLDGPATSMASYVEGGDRRLVVGADDGSLAILDASTGAKVGEGSVPAHSGAVRALATYELASKPRVASAGDEPWIRLWDADTLERSSAPLEGHRGRVLSIAGGPGTVLTGGEDGSIRTWDAVSGRLKDAENDLGLGPVRVLSAAPAGLRPVVAGGDSLRFLAGGGTPAPADAFLEPVRAIAWAADGACLAAGGDDGVLHVWRSPYAGPAEVRALDGPIRGLAWLHLGELGDWLAVVGTGRSFRLHRAGTLEPEGAAFEGHLDWVMGACALPSGDQLATVGDDGRVCLWQPKLHVREDAAAQPAVIGSHDGPARAIVAVGGALVTGGDDETVRAWDMATGAERIRAHVGARVNALCAVGSDVAVATDDGHMVIRLLGSG